MMLICLIGSVISALSLYLCLFLHVLSYPVAFPFCIFVLLVGTISSRLAIREWLRDSYLSKNTL